MYLNNIGQHTALWWMSDISRSATEKDDQGDNKQTRGDSECSSVVHIITLVKDCTATT